MDASVIWWYDYCGNDTLYNAYWSDSLTMNTSNPDLTLCFQDTVLLAIPTGLFWLIALFYLPYLIFGRTARHGWLDFSVKNALKTIVGIVMIIDLLIALIVVNSIPNHTQAELVAYIVKLITFFTYTCIMRLEYIKGIHTSISMFASTTLFLVAEIVPFRSYILRSNYSGYIEDVTLFILYYIYFAMLFVFFLCTFFSDLDAIGPQRKFQRKNSNHSERTPLLHSNGNMKLGAFEKNRDGKDEVTPCPKLTCPAWKIITFFWLLMDVLRGYKTPVTFKKLYDILPTDTCDDMVPKYNKYFYSVQPKNRTPGVRSGNSFFYSLFWSAAWPILIGIVVQWCNVVLMVLQPQVLNLLINFVENGDPYTWKGILIAVTMLCISLGQVLCTHNFLYHAWLGGMKARTVANAIVYRKALKLSGAAKKCTTTGEIVNMMSVDAQKVQDGFTFVNLLWQAPLLTIICVYMMYRTIGISAIAGLAVLLILLPVNGFLLANKVRQLQAKQMVAKDVRLKSMNEILAGIKILKLYAWEPSFITNLLGYRDKELDSLKYANLANAASNIAWFLCPFLVSLAVFACYVLISPENVLTADKAFVTLSYINVFNFPLSLLPLGVTFAGQGIVSIRRITKFLDMDEIKEDYVERHYTKDDGVKIENGDFSWDITGRPILKNINFSVPSGKLVAIVGHVGSGKSSLISALLGEMVKHRGRVEMNGSQAYVPQQAWIQCETLRDNILFGKAYSRTRYEKVLEACALMPDLKVLDGGDMTEIGEKGINLSGGQKQRVSLARAVYQSEDIYLLDDPLSAVDAHVGKHIFDNVIGPKGYLANKTRVLVTHGITYLPQCDLIIVLKDGEISEKGDYHELLNKNGDFSEFLRNYLYETDEALDLTDTEALHLHRQLSVLSASDSDIDITSSMKQRRKKRAMSRTTSMVEAPPKLVDAPKKLIQEETAEVGVVKWPVIMTYVRAGGMQLFVLVIIFHLLFTISQIFTNLWLSEWSGDVPDADGLMDASLVDLRLGVYGGLGLAQAITVGIVLTVCAFGCVNSSKNLHESLLNRIMHATMAFFDTTPLGRIMNRFAKDMDVIDTNMPLFLRGWLFAIAPLCASVVVITYTTPIFLVVIVPMAVFYYFAQKVYITYVGQLKRIDSMRRSPIFAHFDETISGASSIRAYKKENEFIEKCDVLIDESQRPFFLTFVSQRLLGVVLETMGAFIVFFAALFSVLQRDSLSAGLVGLSVSYALQIISLLNNFVRCAAELETYMVSVERIDEYCNVPTEAPWKVPGQSPSPEWPEAGQLSFNNYETRYRPGLDLVLKGVTCHIDSGEQIGIVGRTGAGKSSLALALFRIIEAAGGSISIDGVNLSKMGLHDLRTKLTIIPQDPIVFSGNLRLNLDPFGEYSDNQLWVALEHAHLKEFVEGLSEGLDYECGESGESLSVGQRQLVCLARALLRKCKILVLDEATAAVDLETDALIQNTIRTQFKGCTVLTVAHRINTIMDYNKIMVLDNGMVKEFDTPSKLLEDSQTIFYSLAKEAGLV